MSNVTFNFGALSPPNGWYFQMPPEAGGVLLQAATKDMLLLEVRAEHEKAGVPVPADLNSVVVRHTCEYQPDGFCGGAFESKVAKRVTLEMCYDGSRAAWERDGGSGVTEAEYIRRLNMCDACDSRRKIAGCGSCSPVVGFGRRLTRMEHSRDVWSGNWVCTRDNCAISVRCKCEADPHGCFAGEKEAHK